MKDLIFNSEEYNNTIHNYINQQYQNFFSDEINDSYQEDMKEERNIRQKLFKYNDGVSDLTNIKKDKIKDFIFKSNGIKVGSFLIKIISNNYDKINICIYEEKHKILSKLDILKDKRFSCAWVGKYFTTFKVGKDIPIEIFIDIIRWLQGVVRMTVFI